MKADEKEGKRQRQSQSCDACRVRKVKCESISAIDDKDPPTALTEQTLNPISDTAEQKPTSQAPAASRPPCKQCVQLGSDCTYEYVPRKRGPPNLYLRKLSEAKQNGIQFPSEADFEAAKASSRGVAGRRKAKGKGSGAGHELEHTSEAAKKEENDMTGQLPGSEEGGYGEYLPSLVMQPPSHTFGQPCWETGTEVKQRVRWDTRPAAISKLMSVIAGPIPEDAFTPSQFMDLEGNLNYTASPGVGKLSPNASRNHLLSDTYTPGLSNVRAFESDTRTSFNGGNNMAAYPPKLTGLADIAASTSRHLHSPSTNGQMMLENTLNPIISPIHFDPAGAYFTSPSDAGSIMGMGRGNSHFANNNGRLRSDIPERLGSTPSEGLPLDMSLPESVHNDFLAHDTRTYSTSAVHRDPSTGGTDIHMPLPMHPSNSQTVGEVGSAYLYGQSSGINGPSGHQSGINLQTLPLHRGFHSKNEVSGIDHGPAPSYASGQPSRQSLNSNPLEAIIPRPLLHLIINLFFDYVYPLTPCLHKPTFLADLARHREMEPGQGEWTALVLATVMSTLVQVPRAFVPLTRREVKDLAYRCHIAGRNWSLHGYKDFTVNAVIIRYFVYNYCRGEIATCHTSLCEAQALSTVLKLHEEEVRTCLQKSAWEHAHSFSIYQTYTYLNPIEREVRRRIFFLLFQADKSESVLSGRPIRMREEECYSLRLPEELDDEYITETRYLQQPKGSTSVITGFNASIRIHCLGGRAITKHQEDKREPPSGVRLQRRLEEVATLLEEVTNLMRDCPPQLRLKEGLDSRVQSPAGGWDVEAAAKIQAFFFDPQASREFARNAFLVQQGNIWVTQQCIRFVLLQYQNDLLHLKAASTLKSSMHATPGFKQIGGLPLGGISTSKKPEEETKDYVAASKESLYYDLLSILHSIPIQCIAVNGPSLANCVRYVASGLLDTVQCKSEYNSDGEANVARAQGYLIDFLSILSDIEKNYSLDDDE
ncbi:hypothetical protein QFC22_004597 [Naganishia vaughanmartiniae]|uniref:Uncharacterized protein n=1 Tax=Naganishia vaughanmartiniae TaxID=1424756 RepID=A0ACC2X0P3_9TREE|nr:hypothetical protein QFC22_004597 [Naganishia vaughanmartiniae]